MSAVRSPLACRVPDCRHEQTGREQRSRPGVALRTTAGARAVYVTAAFDEDKAWGHRHDIDQPTAA
jgi:hypothetical protein